VRPPRRLPIHRVTFTVLPIRMATTLVFPRKPRKHMESHSRHNYDPLPRESFQVPRLLLPLLPVQHQRPPHDPGPSLPKRERSADTVQPVLPHSPPRKKACGHSAGADLSRDLSGYYPNKWRQHPHFHVISRCKAARVAKSWRLQRKKAGESLSSSG
jgi:hypothetical protein